MLDPPIKLAIVGCGRVTDVAHLPAALRSPTVCVAALVDSVLENARALARTHRLKDCLIADDLSAVLDKVDGVLIAAPNHAHFSLAQTALAHGIPVLVEKPLTVSYEDALALCALAETQHSFISVGYMTRHYPSVRLLRDLLHTGYLGTVTAFHYECGAKGGWEPVSGYNLDPRRAGGGVLVVQGTHFIDRMLHLFGHPESFDYADDNYGGLEANCKAKFCFKRESGTFEGTMFLSKTRPLKNHFTLYTDLYTCILAEWKAESLTLFPRNRPGLVLEAYPEGEKPSDPARSHYQVQLEEFAGIIRKGGQPTVDGRFAAQSVKLIEEMYRHRTQLEEPWVIFRSRPAEPRAFHV
jgi:predicted dehydrogenase